MEREDRASEVFEFSVPPSYGFDFFNLAVDSFCSGVGVLIAQRVTDAFSVSFKHLGDLGDFLYGLLLHAFKPELEILFCIRERAASKDGLEVLPWPPSNADLQVQFLDGLENIFLICGAVHFVFQECVTAMFERILLLDLASAHLIYRLVEIQDQMKAIMDQRGVREQLCDARNVGRPHIGRNGLDLVL